MKTLISTLLLCLSFSIAFTACNKKPETNVKQAPSVSAENQKLYQLKFDWVANDEEANQKAINELLSAQSFSIEPITLPTSKANIFQHRIIAISKLPMSMADLDALKNKLHQISPNGNLNSSYTVFDIKPK